MLIIIIAVVLKMFTDVITCIFIGVRMFSSFSQTTGLAFVLQHIDGDHNKWAVTTNSVNWFWITVYDSECEVYL